MLRDLEVLASKETHYFRVISNLDNKTKDTLEKETANDDIVVSNNDTKATPKTVFVRINLLLLITSMQLITMNLLMTILK